MIIFPERYWICYLQKGSFMLAQHERDQLEAVLKTTTEANRWERVRFTDITGSPVIAFRCDFSAIFESTPETRDAERHQSAMMRQETQDFNLEHNVSID